MLRVFGGSHSLNIQGSGWGLDRTASEGLTLQTQTALVSTLKIWWVSVFCLPSKIFLALPLARLCLTASLVFWFPGKFIQWEELTENWRDAIEKMLWYLYPFLSFLWVSVSIHVAITLAALPRWPSPFKAPSSRLYFQPSILGSPTDIPNSEAAVTFCFASLWLPHYPFALSFIYDLYNFSLVLIFFGLKDTGGFYFLNGL